MKCQCDCRSARFWIFVVFTSLFVYTPASRAADFYLNAMKANRILLLGNSITLHPPKLEIGWTHNWGMAASTQDNDYAHRLVTSINGRTGGNLTLDPTDPTITNPDGSAVVGDANLINVCGMIEWGYAGYNNSMLEQQIAANPDIVVLEVGENIDMDSFDGVAFKSCLQTLMTGLQGGSNPNIFVTSCILGPNATVDAIKQEVCGEDPARRFFVDMSGFRQDGTNLASAEPYYQDTPRVLGHPGDKGMAFVADTLFDAMLVHSVPEPSSITMFLMAAMSLGAVAWRRRACEAGR